MKNHPNPRRTYWFRRLAELGLSSFGLTTTTEAEAAARAEERRLMAIVRAQKEELAWLDDDRLD